MKWLLCRELIHKTVASLQLRSPNDTAIGTDCCAHGNVMTVPRTACSEPGLIREAVKALNLRCRKTEGIIRTHHVPTLRTPGVTQVRKKPQARAEMRLACKAHARLRGIESLLAENAVLDASVRAQGAICRESATALRTDMCVDKGVTVAVSNIMCVGG